MQRYTKIISLLFAIILMTGCSIRKYIPEGKSLLVDNKIVIENQPEGIDKSDISKRISTKSMNSLFGWFPFVWVYYKTENKTDKKFFKWVNEKIGNKPSYFSDQECKSSKEDIETYLNDIGFFKSKVKYSSEVKNNRTTVTYTITPAQPYIIKNINYDIADKDIQNEIKIIQNSIPVKEGDRYNAYTMDDERDFIMDHMRNNGLYFFSKDRIFYRVDTNFRAHRADVTLQILGDDHNKYFIDQVYIYPDYKQENTTANDTLSHTFSLGGKENVTFNFINSSKSKIRPNTFNQIIQIHHGDIYCQKRVAQTYHALGSLPIYSRSVIRFDTVPNNDNDSIKKLNCSIMLQKGKPNSYSLQMDVTNSGGVFGFLGGLTYKNNNFFHGSEVFTAKLKGGYDLLDKQSREYLINELGMYQRYEFGIETNVLFPRFLGPFSMKHFVQEYLPKTNISLGYNLKSRVWYRIHSIVTSFGYNWMTNSKLQHNLTPININAVKVDRTPEFDSILQKESSARIKDQYTSHLIFGLNYSITFSNQDYRHDKDFFYVKADIETSGNLLSLFNGAMSNVDGHYELFGIRYSQYIKLSGDFRFYHYFNKGNIALRFLAGYGIPYGNSYDMPFEKNYFSGGANSMRAWPYRGIGPGSFYFNNNDTKLDQYGNIQLEFNLEYRFPIYSFFAGAVFADVGNVWNSKYNESLPGSDFQFDRFYKELGIDAGLGIRLDFSFFLIRFDFAIPCRDPKYEESERWRFKKWQWKDVAFNFGIGYPF